MNLLPIFLQNLPYFAYVVAAVYLLVVVCLAVAVFKDAHTRNLTDRGTFLVGPFLWAAIILLTGGFTGALAYWLIHYSSLRYAPRD